MQQQALYLCWPCPCGLATTAVAWPDKGALIQSRTAAAMPMIQSWERKSLFGRKTFPHDGTSFTRSLCKGCLACA